MILWCEMGEEQRRFYRFQEHPGIAMASDIRTGVRRAVFNSLEG